VAARLNNRTTFVNSGHLNPQIYCSRGKTGASLVFWRGHASLSMPQALVKVSPRTKSFHDADLQRGGLAVFEGESKEVLWSGSLRQARAYFHPAYIQGFPIRPIAFN
jgi:hypothetical protein